MAAVKMQVPLKMMMMMLVLLCASAGASTAGLDDSVVADEVAQYPTTPAPSTAGLDHTLVAEEVAQYATSPVPSGDLGATFLQTDVDGGIDSPAPAPISTGLDETLLAGLAGLDEVASSAAVTGLELDT